MVSVDIELDVVGKIIIDSGDNVQSLNIASVGIANGGITHVELASSAELIDVEAANNHTTVEEAIVLVGDVAVSTEDFPPLQSPDMVKGRGKGNKGSFATFVGSKNKFEVLAGADNEIDEPRKPRNASLGVAALLQEIKVKKACKVKIKGSEAIGFTLGA
ncbi:hypothetical protein V6N11_067751 [Hibiscus sabdariffa]|uniref:Uncharacterized protein n=1 Tax=Hibiscus sabdariffa TaxID=183260 RepID=A0ABR2SRR2_9ROSI